MNGAADGGMPAPVAVLESLSQTAVTSSGACRVLWHSWGSGPALLLLHGGAGSWMHWVRNIPVLALRYRVIAPDLPGMGESDLPDDPSGARAIAAILKHGLQTLPGGRSGFDVVGFSFGGLIGAYLAMLAPGKVRSLTLTGTVGWKGVRFNTVDLAPVRGLPDSEQWNAHRANVGRMMISDPGRVDDTAVWIQAANARRLRLDSRGFYAQADLAGMVGSLAVTTGGIWGERDATVRPRVAELGRAIAGLVPRLDFRQIEGAGHWVQYEAADAFNAIALEMLERSRPA